MTRAMIEKRAEEIAFIHGRSRPAKEDRLEARRELLDMYGIRDEAADLEQQLDSLDPSDTRAIYGRQAPVYPADDEERVQAKLVEQGIEEADHEQMVEGHFAMREEEVGDEEEPDEHEAV